MFTGIVEGIATVSEVAHAATGTRLKLALGVEDEIVVGESIAVNGVCLTATASGRGWVSMDVVMETLSRTNLGHLEPGNRVNFERAMSASGRFDGHIVQGHVDGTARVASISEEGEAKRMGLTVPDDLVRYVVPKGSLTVDGVSLTVAGMQGDRVDVALIPHTLEKTTLGLRNVDDTVNLEVDILAKYVERLITA